MLVYTRAVSWLTNSCQLVISWLGIVVSCGGAIYPAIFHIRVSLLVGRLVWYGTRISRRLQEVLPRCEHTERSSATNGVSPIAIDCAGAGGGRAEGAGSTEPGLFYFLFLFLLVVCYCVPNEYLRICRHNKM